MAITAVEYALIRQLRVQGVLPLGGSLIEFGEANWYGNIALGDLAADIARFARPEDAPVLKADVERLGKSPAALAPFDLAKIFYKSFTHFSKITAVDFNGTDAALRLDLNEPITGIGAYDMAFDFGTGEHVFDVRRFFENVHDLTNPKGLMIHGLPWNGWVDHGFYNFQPTLFFDLAAANDYKVHFVCCATLEPFSLQALNTRDAFVAFAKAGRMGANPMIYAVMSKPDTHKPFRVPIQGYYGGALNADLVRAWETMR